MEGWTIVFRVDASLAIGTGHVMRCLALAGAMRLAGAKTHFVCRDHTGHLGARITAAGHGLTLLPGARHAGEGAQPVGTSYASWLGADWQTDAAQTLAEIGALSPDWLVVDHYAIDARWESRVRTSCPRLLVIDDLAERSHDCVLLLDQNPGSVGSDYQGLVPEDTASLLGPSYALLRPEFSALRQFSLDRRPGGGVRRILVSMGGVDLGDATGRVLQALARRGLPSDCQVCVILGSQSPALARVLALAQALPFSCRVQVDASDMASLMAASDLAIGSAGTSALERCCMGLPAVAVLLAENQRRGALALARAQAIDLIEEIGGVDDALAPMLDRYFLGDRLEEVSMAARNVTDGLGVGRVLRAMESLP